MMDQPHSIWSRAVVFLGRPSGCLLFLAAFFIAIWLHCRIGALVELGSDEGFEVLKGSLCSHGGRLYAEIWNDQPPIHTWLLATSFRLSSASMTVARLIASGFGLLLFVSTFGLARRSGGPLAGWLACLTLLGAPEALRLSMAAMLEAPAMGVGLASVWAAFIWKQDGRAHWLIFSGLLMGMALQIKFTSALFLPALLADLAAFSWTTAARNPRIAFRSLTRALAMWTGPMLAAFSAVVAAFPGWSVNLLWFSHSAAAAHLSGEAGSSFSIRSFGEGLSMICGAGLFLVHPVLLRRWGEFVFYYILIATLFLVHWFHRPYWPYYILHFDVAFSLTSGLGLAALAASLLGVARATSGLTGRTVAAVVTFSAFLACVGSGAFLATQIFLDETKHAARIQDPGSIPQILASYRAPGVLFSTSPLAAFYARMPVIPDLALLPRKRFWAGQITYLDILDRLKTVKPSRIILQPDVLAQPGWPRFLEKNYDLYNSADRLLFYRAKFQPPVKASATPSP
jgi:hypothetical protein